MSDSGTLAEAKRRVETICLYGSTQETTKRKNDEW